METKNDFGHSAQFFENPVRLCLAPVSRGCRSSSAVKTWIKGHYNEKIDLYEELQR